MNRNLMRYTLIGLVLLAAVFAAAPEVTKALGITTTWPALGTVSEKEVTRGPCVDEGVTLVIDYGTASGRATQAFCAARFGTSSVDSGWNLFGATRQSVEGTADYPTGFVCRINGFPNKQTQSCTHVPGIATGTWAYFVATDASGWHYAQFGAADSHPKCGGWQGWRFQNPGSERVQPPRMPAVPFKCNG